MVNLDIQDKTILIKKYIDDEISNFLKDRAIHELSTNELIELNNILKCFDDFLDDKLEMQEEKLNNLKHSIRSKLDALAKSNK